MRSLPLWKPILIAIISFVSLLYALPSLMGGAPGWWPSFLPSEVIHRGLDLQGGLHLLLGVETDKAVMQVSENTVDEIRRELREQKLRYRGLERKGLDTLVIRLSPRSDVKKISEIIKEKFTALEPLESSTEEGKGSLLFRLHADEVKKIRESAVTQAIQTIRSRVDEFGVSEPSIQKQGQEEDRPGEGRILIQLPGLKDPARAKEIIGRTAQLEFKLVDEENDITKALDGRIPPKSMILYGSENDRATGKKVRQPYLLKKRTEMAGNRLVDANVQFDSQFNEPYVLIKFDRQGSRMFARITGENVKKRMAIVLDKRVYSAPVIQEKIEGGIARITGDFDLQEARDLAIVLRSGALPAPVYFMEERTVGPTLGSDSVAQGLQSILMGGALVLLFMILYYKGFGALANIAVVLNIIILMAILTTLQATLTLPGIAGAVLLLGMAVDANVLIFERIREELKVGKTPRAAINHGYEKAFATILDANITTLITALVLFQFGTGPIRGFAVTLSIGILASMFTAIFMTRVILEWWTQGKRLRKLSI
ncbi:protein translocase subunit SecD [Magnetococcales bacterium HHB-1]